MTIMFHLFVERKSASISNMLYVHIILTNAMFKSYVNHLRPKWKGKKKKIAMHDTLKKKQKIMSGTFLPIQNLSVITLEYNSYSRKGLSVNAFSNRFVIILSRKR